MCLEPFSHPCLNCFKPYCHPCLIRLEPPIHTISIVAVEAGFGQGKGGVLQSATRRAEERVCGARTPVLHCPYAIVTMCLHYSYTVLTQLSQYSYTVVILFLHCDYIILREGWYKVVRKLVRLIPNGVDVKHEVDEVSRDCLLCLLSLSHTMTGLSALSAQSVSHNDRHSVALQPGLSNNTILTL
jgi:hypothetical protein